MGCVRCVMGGLCDVCVGCVLCGMFVLCGV